MPSRLHRKYKDCVLQCILMRVSNYAPTIHPQTLAAERGYSQILWLLQDKVTEVGTMNLFCLWKTPEGELELITAPLDGK